MMEQQAAAVGRSSRSARLRVLAAVLTSNVFFLASCTGGMLIANGAWDKASDLHEIPIDEAHPPRFRVPVVATVVNPTVPTYRQLTVTFVRNPTDDLAKFELDHPGYSFLPPADTGYVPDPGGGPSVEYRVAKREAGKALVKTHYHDDGVIGDLYIHGTYEATDSAVRLVSSRGDVVVTLFILFAGLIPALFLKDAGKSLQRRVGTPAEEPKDVARPRRWQHALATSVWLLGGILVGVVASKVTGDPGTMILPSMIGVFGSFAQLLLLSLAMFRRQETWVRAVTLGTLVAVAAFGVSARIVLSTAEEYGLSSTQVARAIFDARTLAMMLATSALLSAASCWVDTWTRPGRGREQQRA